MATNQKVEPADCSFAWGDTVRVRSSAPQRFRPSKLGAICAISLEGDNSPEESCEYLVEFGDGQAMEIPEMWLEQAAQ